MKDTDDNNVTESTETIIIDDSKPDNEQPADDKAQTISESSSQDEGVDDTVRYFFNSLFSIFQLFELIQKASNDDSNETATAEDNFCDTTQICPSYYYPYMYGPPPIMPFGCKYFKKLKSSIRI